ncbi:hypothetical protein K501DRAFT_271195 [Backusella circina FSU 941]|nr:hypothetical protein K501DRAFT_271195 [Backusella circina FSU 941]
MTPVSYYTWSFLPISTVDSTRIMNNLTSLQFIYTIYLFFLLIFFFDELHLSDTFSWELAMDMEDWLLRLYSTDGYCEITKDPINANFKLIRRIFSFVIGCFSQNLNVKKKDGP